MPFALDGVRVDITCGPGPSGRWHCTLIVRVPGELLRPLGLHPDQPTAQPAAIQPPGWWHAEAELRARRGIRCGVVSPDPASGS